MKRAHNAGRRDFLTRSLPAAALLCSCRGSGSLPLQSPAAPASRSKVVVARDPELRGRQSTPNTNRLQALLDRAIAALAGVGEPVEAWKRIVRPSEQVTLKVNTLGGRGIATSPLLVEALCERLQQAGVRAGDIVVWDRDTAEMERAGFRIVTGGSGVQCYGTDRVGYEEELSAWGAVGSLLSKILTRRTSLLINLPVLKDHDGAGVTLALKNMYGAIHNPNKYHPNGCDPYVADLNMLPEIRSRMRLVVCDATTAMYDGGPAFKPERSWQANALLVSQDPVALDTTGWRTIERKRAEKGLKTLEAEQRPPRYIATAADSEHRLGNNDPARIDVVEV
ncbi:MAG: DUF362 domain-containing protein [Terracidiphilus sp.]